MQMTFWKLEIAKKGSDLERWGIRHPGKLNQNNCTLERLLSGPFCRFYVAYCKHRPGNK